MVRGATYSARSCCLLHIGDKEIFKIEKLSERLTKLNERLDKIDRTAPIYTERLSKLTSKIDIMKYELEQKNISNKAYEKEFFHLMKPKLEKLIIERTNDIIKYEMNKELIKQIESISSEYLKSRIDELNNNIIKLTFECGRK